MEAQFDQTSASTPPIARRNDALTRTVPSQRAGNPAPRVPQRAANGWARGLGWFSMGLGALELLAPAQIARLIGIADSPRIRLVLRALGARELAAGLGLLVPRRPGRFLWSRVAGDAVDLALLGGVLASKEGSRTARTGGALAIVAGVTAVDLWASLRRQDPDQGDGAVLARSSAPAAAGDPSVPVRAVITIGRPAAELYKLWRDFENLPRFMSHVRSVEVRDRLRSHWTVSITGRDELSWDAIVTEDRPDELIAWRSVQSGTIDHGGQVRFVAAPGGRGTEVHLQMNVLPPAGAVGKAVGKLVHRLPEQIIAADLKRLKQLVETGEVMKSDASIHRGRHPARPQSDGE